MASRSGGPASSRCSSAEGATLGPVTDGGDQSGLHPIAERLRSGLDDGDIGPLLELLDDDVIWGSCSGAVDVRAFVDSVLAEPIEVTGGEVEGGDDRLVVSLRIEVSGVDGAQPHMSVVAVFVDDGRITEICDAEDRAQARRLRPVGPLDVAAARPTAARSVSPVLPVADLDRAVDHYRRLGFEVERYQGGAPYAFATLDEVQLHLAQVADLDPAANTSAVYLYVDDADALYARWHRAGVDGRLFPPVDTDYRLREGSHIDVDGNLLRFGSESPPG